jgi:hypothetical protein
VQPTKGHGRGRVNPAAHDKYPRITGGLTKSKKAARILKIIHSKNPPRSKCTFHRAQPFFLVNFPVSGAQNTPKVGICRKSAFSGSRFGPFLGFQPFHPPVCPFKIHISSSSTLHFRQFFQSGRAESGIRVLEVVRAHFGVPKPTTCHPCTAKMHISSSSTLLFCQFFRFWGSKFP